MMACCTLRELTVTTFWGESFSMLHCVPLFTSRACCRETDGSEITISLYCSRPIVIEGLLMGKVVPASGPVRNLIETTPGRLLMTSIASFLSTPGLIVMADTDNSPLKCEPATRKVDSF